MKTEASFQASIIGDTSNSPYVGSFTVRTVLTRRDQFLADQIRREVVGPQQGTVLPSLVDESFMYSQVRVRVVKAPDWYTNSYYGLDLVDSNVMPYLFKECTRVAAEAEEERQKEVEAAKKSLLEA
jgi:hypothetical protein